MPKQSLKFFLTCQDKLVLANATEKELHDKVAELLGAARPGSEPVVPKDFKAFVGRELPIEIDTGVRVRLVQRVHKKDGNGTRKPRTPKATKTDTTTAAPPAA